MTAKELIKYRKQELLLDLERINQHQKETNELKLRTEGALLILKKLEEEL